MKKIGFLGFAVVLLIAEASGEPITVKPSNPHYYLFHGQPTILITSAEHYGALVNLDFDYVAYLNTLKATASTTHASGRERYSRSWGSSVREIPSEPRPDRTIVPWARSNQPGYVYGGNKFDLDKWNAENLARLKDFLAKAAERGIIVEISFFNSQYTHRWPLSPFYREQHPGMGKCDFKDAQTLKYPDLVQRESEYVSKITQEVNDYDNVILEICDEPALFTAYEEAGPWVGRLLEVVHNTESTLPKKHLLAQMVEGPIGGPIDSGPSYLSVIVGQYVWGGEAGRERMGGMKGLDYEYGYKKPIELNETPYYPFQYRVGDAVAASRVEAWEFIVGGGASFNHLNARYTAEDSAGNTSDNAQVLSALRNLKNFIYSFDFVKMRGVRASSSAACRRQPTVAASVGRESSTRCISTIVSLSRTTSTMS